MTIRNLEYLFEPSTVAVIGATESETSIAGIVTRNLIERFRGTVQLVNPMRSAVHGRPCLPRSRRSTAHPIWRSSRPPPIR